MKEKANYPNNNNNTNTTKIDHFLAFRRKAKMGTIWKIWISSFIDTYSASCCMSNGQFTINLQSQGCSQNILVTKKLGPFLFAQESFFVFFSKCTHFKMEEDIHFRPASKFCCFLRNWCKEEVDRWRSEFFYTLDILSFDAGLIYSKDWWF